jgi:acyl-CoA synthetase (AMP-forming)/AMP-acid ligase II
MGNVNPGENASAEEIIAWCRQNLAGYKTPRYVVFTELPKTSTGKIQKFRLREMTKNVAKIASLHGHPGGALGHQEERRLPQ